MMLLHHKTQSSKHPKTNPTQILRVVPSGVGATERLLARKWWCRQEMGHSLSWDLPWHWPKPRRMQGFDHWPYDGAMVGQNTRKRSSQQRSWSFLYGATNPWNFDHRVWRCAVSWILNHSSFHFEPSFFFEIWWLPPIFLSAIFGSIAWRFPDLVQQKYQSTHQDGLKKLCDNISENAAVLQAVKAHHQHGASTASGGTAGSNVAPPRTMATPEWESETPWNCLKRLTISGISIADFDSGNTIPNCMNMFFLIFPSKKTYGGWYLKSNSWHIPLVN